MVKCLSLLMIPIYLDLSRTVWIAVNNRKIRIIDRAVKSLMDFSVSTK